MSPDLLRHVDHQLQLAALLICRDMRAVAIRCGVKTALRTDSQLIDRAKLGGFLDLAYQVFRLLERGILAADQAEYHDLALGQMAQRLVAADPAGVVVFE